MALAALVVHILVRILTAFSINYYMFIAGRFLTSIADIAWYSSLYVFSKLQSSVVVKLRLIILLYFIAAAVEIVGPKWRVLSGMTLYYFWLVGYPVLAVLAYFIRGWRMLTLVITALCLPYLAHFW